MSGSQKANVHYTNGQEFLEFLKTQAPHRDWVMEMNSATADAYDGIIAYIADERNKDVDPSKVRSSFIYIPETDSFKVLVYSLDEPITIIEQKDEELVCTIVSLTDLGQLVLN